MIRIVRSCLFLALIFITNFNLFSQSISTPTLTFAGSAPYCPGSAVSVKYTTVGTYTTGNVFTVQLSDASGSFVSTGTASIGTLGAVQTGTATANTRTTACVIPYTTPTSLIYRIRVVSSNPIVNGTDNGYGFSVNGLSISTPTITNTTFCQGEIFNLSYTIPCAFAASNTFTAQLSDATGSFASPVNIGTKTTTGGSTTFSVTIPPGTPYGTGYRINIISGNPTGVTSPDNGIDLTINVPSGTPGVFGSGVWNAYCYNGLNNFTSNYQGYYTESNLSYSTTTRFTNTVSPSMANASSGAAYAGCPFGSGTQYSVSYMRTNIPCGIYQIDIPSHDDYVYLLINGSYVQLQGTPTSTVVGCCAALPDVWTGFIGPSTTIEVRYSNNGGPGNLAVNITPVNPLTMSTPVTVCAGTSATLSVANSNTVAVNYSWSPASTVSPTTGMTVTATPTVSTIYTVSATDAGSPSTGCAITNTVNITVNPVATTTVALTLPGATASYTPTAICYGVNTATLTAGGANSYTWSPAAGLSSTSGYSVVANPTITTTYTVSGSNNCTTVDASTVVSVQVEPTTPVTTTFGNNTWNVYCHNNTTLNSYYGYYTENNLSYNTTTRWNSNLGPSTCTTTSTGLPYSGCSFGGVQWSMSFKRTGTPCGYYSLDVNYQDDQLKFLVNGVQVFSNTGYTTVNQPGVWTGFIGPSTTLEFQLINGGGPGQMQVTFNPISYPVLNPPTTICAGTSTNLFTNFITGATYAWTPTVSTTPANTYTSIASPTVTTSYTCTVTDPVTTCSASASVPITVNPLPTTSVTPTTGTISCAINSFTLTASGANTYSWNPSAGLSSATGNTVVATPTITTTYTVTGNNNCANVDATTTITVVPLISPTVIPTGVWNAYCYGDQTFTNYYGYYTENGGGTSGYDFNTTTRWVSTVSGTLTPSPSNANSTNGTSYKGCVIPNTNFGISFKRTGFACGTYSVNFTQDDYFYLYVNGTAVAQRTAAGTENGVWVGVLNSNSTVEIRLVQGTSTSNMTVTFVPVTIPATQCTWVGGTSTDWFTAANWCGGGGVPTSAYDVVIPAAGPQFMPVIGASSAQCRSITINPAIAAGTYNLAIPSASLTTASSFSLDVYGNWTNKGVYIPNSGTINMTGTTASTIISGTVTPEIFSTLTINNPGGVTASTGTVQVSNVMNFVSGIVSTNNISTTPNLQILAGAGVSGASNSSYVDGFIVKYGKTAFTFPVGTGGYYRPASISAPSNITDYFTCKYFHSNPFVSPYNTTCWDPFVDHLSGCEYWIVNRSSGGSNVNVTLTWDGNSCGVTALSDLIVARYDAGTNCWKNQGNGGTTGTTATGSIITNGVVTNFSPFTLASTNPLTNPLPIELTNFSCNFIKKGEVQLKWTTATETNNDYFSLERSTNGVDFNFVQKIKGAGNSTHNINYSFTDNNAPDASLYYRLKQTDFNGNYTYHEICAVSNNTNTGVSFYPNPANNSVTIDVTGSGANLLSYAIKNSIGQDIGTASTNNGGKILVDVSRLTPGIYFVQVILDNQKIINHTITIQR